MKRIDGAEQGAMAAALAVACCAAPIIGAVGLTVGIAALTALFVGVLAAIIIGLAGLGWIATRRRRG